MRHMLYAIVFFALRVCIFVVLNFTFKDRDHITYACDALVMFSFSTGVEIFWMILERLTFGYAKTHQMMRGKMYSTMYSIPILFSSFYRVRNAMRKEFCTVIPRYSFNSYIHEFCTFYSEWCRGGIMDIRLLGWPIEQHLWITTHGTTVILPW